MSTIKIITDSTADIPLQVRESNGIEMVPLKVHFGEETFYDAVTIHADEFYAKLVKASQLPTTSQPSPVDFLEVYKRILNESDCEIISIHLSAALSGTYQSAVLAKSLLDPELSERVTVIDTKSASYGFGMLAVAAAEAAAQGKSKEDITAMIDQFRQDTRLYFVVDTLEYLYKGGRIGKASAMLGSLLNIKPILSIDKNGEVDPVEKVRGQKKALSRIIELLEQDLKDKTIDLTVAYTDNQQPADELRKLIEQKFNINQLTYTHIGPVIGTHVGPGTAAVFVKPVS